MQPTSVVLVTVSGPDKPGITSALTGILSESNSTILDIGQAVIDGLLSLSILFEIRETEDKKPDPTTLKDLLFKANELGLKLEFQVVEKPQDRLRSNTFRYALTLIADPLSAEVVHQVTQILAKYRLNIDQIQRLSEGDFRCIELLVSATEELDRHRMKTELLRIATEEKVDISLQAEGLFRRTKRLVVLDIDSTLLDGEVIDDLAKRRGVFDEVADLTERAMRGEMDYREALQLRCEKLAGVTREDLEHVWKNLKLTEGADQLIPALKKLGYKVALISGGFTYFAERLRESLGLDYAYANQLEMKNDQLTGRITGPIVDAQRKSDLLDVICQQEKIHLDQVVAIGDGANDLLMLEKAGLGIAFNAKPVVREKADHSLSQKGLHSIFYLLGISGRDLNEVLGAD